MPILNIVLQGDLTKQKVKLDRRYNFKFLKLLHIYHNINSKLFSKTAYRDNGLVDSNIQDHQRLIFCKMNILNADNCDTYIIDPDLSAGDQNNITDSQICFGLTKHNTDANSVFKDLYKVLISGIPKQIDQQLEFKLSTINSKGVLVALESADFVALGTKECSQLVMTFEYEE